VIAAQRRRCASRTIHQLPGRPRPGRHHRSSAILAGPTGGEGLGPAGTLARPLHVDDAPSGGGALTMGGHRHHVPVARRGRARAQGHRAQQPRGHRVGDGRRRWPSSSRVARPLVALSHLVDHACCWRSSASERTTTHGRHRRGDQGARQAGREQRPDVEPVEQQNRREGLPPGRPGRRGHHEATARHRLIDIHDGATASAEHLAARGTPGCSSATASSTRCWA